MRARKIIEWLQIRQCSYPNCTYLNIGNILAILSSWFFSGFYKGHLCLMWKMRTDSYTCTTNKSSCASFRWHGWPKYIDHLHLLFYFHYILPLWKIKSSLNYQSYLLSKSTSAVVISFALYCFPLVIRSFQHSALLILLRIYPFLKDV